MVVNALIEIPMGPKNKYEIDNSIFVYFCHKKLSPSDPISHHPIKERGSVSKGDVTFFL